MIRSLSLCAVVLFIVPLMSSVSAQMQSGGTLAPNSGSAAQIKTIPSVISSSQVLAMWAGPINNGGGNQQGNGNGNNGNGNNGNGNHNKRAPAPEPSTMLSFAAALLVGSGVLYSRRLRRNRK